MDDCVVSPSETTGHSTVLPTSLPPTAQESPQEQSASLHAEEFLQPGGVWPAYRHSIGWICIWDPVSQADPLSSQTVLNEKEDFTPETPPNREPHSPNWFPDFLSLSAAACLDLPKTLLWLYPPGMCFLL